MDKKKKTVIIIGAVLLAFVLAVAGIAVGKYVKEKPAEPAEFSAEAANSVKSTGASKASAAGNTGKYPDFFTYYYRAETDDYIFGEKFFYEAACVPLERSGDTDYFDPYNTVPGLPFLFDYDHSQNIKTGYTAPDEVVFTYSDGRCFTLNGESGEVIKNGQSFERPVTVYWNPYTAPEADPVKEATVTASFRYEGTEIGRQTLTLKRGKSIKGSQGDVYRYSVRVSD